MIVALGLAMGPTVARGLARFAYALLRTDPWDGHSTAGVMNTANALGYYLAGALAGAPLGRRVGSRAAFVGELVAPLSRWWPQRPVQTWGCCWSCGWWPVPGTARDEPRCCSACTSPAVARASPSRGW